jgi:hypothetical protein
MVWNYAAFRIRTIVFQQTCGLLYKKFTYSFAKIYDTFLLLLQLPQYVAPNKICSISKRLTFIPLASNKPKNTNCLSSVFLSLRVDSFIFSSQYLADIDYSVISLMDKKMLIIPFNPHVTFCIKSIFSKFSC